MLPVAVGPFLLLDLIPMPMQMDRKKTKTEAVAASFFVLGCSHGTLLLEIDVGLPSSSPSQRASPLRGATEWTGLAFLGEAFVVDFDFDSGAVSLHCEVPCQVGLGLDFG